MAAVTFSQRCLNHLSREAVARCPECGQFFCRECVTEHDDRVICSACLKRITSKGQQKTRSFGALLRPAHFAFGLLVAWLFFYCVGRVLLSIPPAYHEGTVWEGGFLQDEE
jgi:hypothetical protein